MPVVESGPKEPRVTELGERAEQNDSPEGAERADGGDSTRTVERPWRTTVPTEVERAMNDDSPVVAE